MNTTEILRHTREIYSGMNSYNEGDQRKMAAEQAVALAGILAGNRKFAVAQVLRAWAADEAADEAAAKEAALKIITDRQAAIDASRAAEAAAKAEAAEAAEAAAQAAARRRAVGQKIHGLCGSGSNWYFGSYGADGILVACPKGQTEVIVARRVTQTVGESASEFGKYVAWGAALESHTSAWYEATPDGERILADWTARQDRIKAAREKAAILRSAREQRERDERRRQAAEERAQREAARIAKRSAQYFVTPAETAQPPKTAPAPINGFADKFAALGL
jgi:colicin import membrane protein